VVKGKIKQNLLPNFPQNAPIGFIDLAQRCWAANPFDRWLLCLLTISTYFKIMVSRTPTTHTHTHTHTHARTHTHTRGRVNPRPALVDECIAKSVDCP
jgi:hypothetical protein